MLVNKETCGTVNSKLVYTHNRIVKSFPSLDQTPIPMSFIHHLFPLQAIVCRQESDCPQDFFCDHHFGLCLNFRKEKEYCRHDAQCARGLNCMFGKCHQIVPSGEEGKAWRDLLFTDAFIIFEAKDYQFSVGVS